MNKIIFIDFPKPTLFAHHLYPQFYPKRFYPHINQIECVATITGNQAETFQDLYHRQLYIPCTKCGTLINSGNSRCQEVTFFLSFNDSTAVLFLAI